jgi:alkanesulfonate monooxygenase SsuD/methylene tetrahydromethanopterin reductase-like flavin-dependent oxidoreductase (luciferase family)
MDVAKGNTVRGLGMAAAAPREAIQAGADATREHGYHSFWLNNPPGGSALPILGELAAGLAPLWLGVGVIPLASEPPERIAREVVAHHLPLDRFYLGVGSGSGGIRTVEEGVRVIRADLACRLVLAALGPRMCRLAGEEADGVLLNWLTPEFARRAAEQVREAAERKGRPCPRIMAYVRVALGDEARARLEKEAGNYERIPHYANHFERMGVDAMGTAATGSADRIQETLATWDGIVDELVVRAITAHDTPEQVAQLAEAAAPK